MVFKDWVKKDVSKLADHDLIAKLAMGLGGLAAVAKFFKEKNDMKAMENNVVEEVMKRLNSENK